MGAAYLCFQSAGDGEAWAGLLVVTPRGLPNEFLYSGPLRTTPVQGILSQDRLIPQVRVSLLRALLRGLRSRFVLLAVRAADFEPELASEVRCPVLVVDGDTPQWLRAPDAAAEAMQAQLEAAVGALEPLGRVVAALAYVVEFERRSASTDG